MLILTRGPGDRVVIDCGDGNRIAVGVSSFVSRQGRTRVRLSFDAPDTVRILREEILARPGRADPEPLS